MLMTVLQYAHQLLEQTLEPGDIAIDATCGNGNDTLMLSRLVGDDGRVLAFDIQEQAITATRIALENSGSTNVDLIHDSHEFAGKYLGEADIVSAAIFNLGFLPRSDKTIITRSISTLPAVQTILERLKKHGKVILVVYYGHEGGAEEKEAILQYVTELDQKAYHVLKYQYINQKNNPPFLIAIQKR